MLQPQVCRSLLKCQQTMVFNYSPGSQRPGMRRPNGNTYIRGTGRSPGRTRTATVMLTVRAPLAGTTHGRLRETCVILRETEGNSVRAFRPQHADGRPSWLGQDAASAHR